MDAEVEHGADRNWVRTEIEHRVQDLARSQGSMINDLSVKVSEWKVI